MAVVLLDLELLSDMCSMLPYGTASYAGLNCYEFFLMIFKKLLIFFWLLGMKKLDRKGSLKNWTLNN